MFPETKSRETSGLEHCVFGARATTAQLYPGRDTFQFNQKYVTKNQPIIIILILILILLLIIIIIIIIGIYREYNPLEE